MLSDQSAIGDEETRERLLPWDGCLNARDLGGYLTADGLTTKWGAIVRSDTLSALSPAGRQALRDYGIRSIIDLRLPSELEEKPNPFAVPGDHGVTYIHQSFITPGTPLNMGFPTMVEAYIDGWERHASSIGKVLRAIATAREGGVLFHCNGGRDRTGQIAALLLTLVGVPDETIAHDYALSAEYLRTRDEQYLENGPGERADRERDLVRFRTRPEVMLEALSRLKAAHGDVPPYLRYAGVNDYELDLLRARLVG
jgi:protein-tyrosine phosphatase